MYIPYVILYGAIELNIIMGLNAVNQNKKAHLPKRPICTADWALIINIIELAIH